MRGAPEIVKTYLTALHDGVPVEIEIAGFDGFWQRRRMLRCVDED
jgi:hypothetical protein